MKQVIRKTNNSYFIATFSGLGELYMGPSSNLQMLWLLLIFISTAEATLPAKVFNIKNFGAIANEKIDSSKAILSAWKEACAWDGMGRILIPKETFIVGPLVLKGPCKGPIVFQLKGVMKAHTDLSIFKSDVWIEFQYVKGLLVTGGGTLDGQGASAWPHNQCPKNFKCKILPTSLKLSFVTDATVRGISSINSKFFHMNIFGSKNIKLQAVNISAPDESPNTDGIHIGSSSGIKISRSIIGTGDDCISLGPGSSNVSISNIFCGPGHGISVGSLGKYPNEEDVVGLTVRNCTFTGTTNGLRIKTWEASPASTTASSFTFDDIVMNNVYNPIIIDQEYCPYKSCNLDTPSRVKIDNVSFKNIRGTSSSQVAVNILCSKGVPCQNVKLTDINLAYNVQGVVATAACANVRGTSSGLQIPPSCI